MLILNAIYLSELEIFLELWKETELVFLLFDYTRNWLYLFLVYRQSGRKLVFSFWKTIFSTSMSLGLFSVLVLKNIKWMSVSKIFLKQELAVSSLKISVRLTNL